MSDRSVQITIEGQQYDLVLSTRAAMELSSHYGGLDQIGEKLMKPENTEQAFKEINWIIMTLLNQDIMLYNLRHRGEPEKPLFTVDELELVLTPGELIEFRDKIIEAYTLGLKRNVLSEEDPSKNAAVG